jgi:myo-inositol-1(or 4)-monophosphatase
MQLALPVICQQAREAVMQAGRFIRQEVGKVASQQIEEKSLNSLVSYVDKTAEQLLVQSLGQIIPDSVFLTEEDTINNKDGDIQWIIDPLDGTTNFLYQIPVFSISIGLRVKEEIVLGIIYELNRHECFYAWKGGGAFLNGQPIQVSNRTILSNCLMATGFPYLNDERLPKYLQTLGQLKRSIRGIRRLGSAAVDLAYVACGRFDGYFEYGLQAWDVAAGIIIVREAGGVVCDFSGGQNYLFGKEIIASSTHINKALQSIISSGFV